jgi:Fe-S-cluster containining protein
LRTRYAEQVRPVHALSFHADYQCRHSGACCASDWDVPVELSVYRTLDELIRRGRLRVEEPAADGAPPLITGPDLPEDAAAMLARTGHGACVFFDRRSRLCAVHRDHGIGALPATCRHFPRIAVQDRRGTFITLTHYCPTAAATLFRDDVPVAVVAAPRAFPPGDYEGLQVDPAAWPPLLAPTVLMDLEGYSAWERHMVTRCGRVDLRPEAVLATLERDARLLRRFTPDGRSLAAPVAALPSTIVEAEPPPTLAGSLADHAEVMQAVPEELKPPADGEGLEEAFAEYVAREWDAWRGPLDRYLAAKAFANWTAYQGRGVLSIVRGLAAALSLVRVEASRQCRDAARPLDRALLLEAIRSADFALNHLAVGDELALRWSKAEGGQS